MFLRPLRVRDQHRPVVHISRLTNPVCSVQGGVQSYNAFKGNVKRTHGDYIHASRGARGSSMGVYGSKAAHCRRKLQLPTLFCGAVQGDVQPSWVRTCCNTSQEKLGSTYGASPPFRKAGLRTRLSARKWLELHRRNGCWHIMQHQRLHAPNGREGGRSLERPGDLGPEERPIFAVAAELEGVGLVPGSFAFAC